MTKKNKKKSGANTQSKQMPSASNHLYNWYIMQPQGILDILIEYLNLSRGQVSSIIYGRHYPRYQHVKVLKVITGLSTDEILSAWISCQYYVPLREATPRTQEHIATELKAIAREGGLKRLSDEQILDHFRNKKDMVNLINLSIKVIEEEEAKVKASKIIKPTKIPAEVKPLEVKEEEEPKALPPLSFLDKAKDPDEPLSEIQLDVIREALRTRKWVPVKE